MDRTLSFLIKPKYDHLFDYRHFYLGQKEGRWFVISKMGEVSHIGYEAVTLSPDATCCVVFRDGFTGVLDKYLDYIVPFAPQDSVISDFESLYAIDNLRHHYLPNYHFLHPNKNPHFQFVASRAFTLNNRRLSTDNVYMSYKNYQDESIKRLKHFPKFINELNKPYYERHFKRYIPKALMGQYYSEMILDLKKSRYNSQETLSSQTAYHCQNYQIINGQLIPFEIRQLFTEPIAYDSVIYDILLKRLNQTQALKQYCANMPAFIDRLKANALMTYTGIQFYWGNYNDQNYVSINWPDLKPLYQNRANGRFKQMAPLYPVLSSY